MPSTAIGRIAYDARTRRMTVEFVTSGRRYAYRDVPPEVFEEFRHALAKGVFFNRRIRGRYAAELDHDPAAGTIAPAPLLRP
jgi:hypothetical protein